MKMNRKRVLTGAMLVAMLVLPVIAAPPDSKSTTDRDAAVAEKWIAGWNSHDPDKILPLFTDDFFIGAWALARVIPVQLEWANSFSPNWRAFLISNSS